MDTQMLQNLRNDRAFTELERQRNRFSWILTVLMLRIYIGFILLVAFAPGFMGTPIAGVITLGFPVGIGVILSAITLTGIYVLRANSEFDALTNDIRRRAAP